MVEVDAALTGAWKLIAAVTESTYCLVARPSATVGFAVARPPLRVRPDTVVYVVPEAIVVLPSVGAV